MAKNLFDVLNDFDCEIKESGDKWVIRCPLHEGDDDPSFTIYPNQTFFCFGCKAWGDAVKLLVEWKGMSHADALEYVGIDYQSPRAEKNKVIKLKNTLGTWKFLGRASEMYHQYLLRTQGALNYLHSRGLSNETIAKYKIGYTDGYVLDLKFAEDYALGVQTGLINKDGFEMLSHRITIPNLLDRGEADFLTGRTVVNNKLKYVNTRGSKPIHGFFEIRHSPIVFLAEGQFDMLMLRQWGWPAAVMAGSHMTKQNQLLLESKQIVVIPDNDGPGRATANKLKSHFDNALIFDYGEYGTKDIAEFAQREGAQEIFTYLVREQIPWIMSLSTPILARWFPPSLLTL